MFFASDVLRYELLLAGIEPCHVFDPVVEIDQRQDAEYHRRNRLDNE
jgi:hypothetical protein